MKGANMTVEQIYFADEAEARKIARARIVDELTAMELPGADWEQMER